jgi:hypothetical protein
LVAVVAFQSGFSLRALRAGVAFGAFFARCAGVAFGPRSAGGTGGSAFTFGAAFSVDAEDALLVGAGDLDAFLAFQAFQALAGKPDNASFRAGLLDAEGQRFDRGGFCDRTRCRHQGKQAEANREHSQPCRP